MLEVRWSGPAFRALASLPQEVAFKIIASVDQLQKFPRMGRGIGRRDDEYRVLVIQQHFRVAYRFDEAQSIVFVLALQTTHEPQPSIADLHGIEGSESGNQKE